ncbi:polyamine transporter tpo5 [Saxophila tyrrhenica]|uniref:Polyamine transporter tpo5 n=1 Tax=Saxophila tyrrhenica TaxID=1690608 RepID=A0AAV9P4T7_9PEZI|nr:polyamine transporter tpo5 [Saxophila tyrrhenica]
MAEPQPTTADLSPEQLRQRRESLTTVELRDSKGRTRSVAVEDLTEADKALAAEFGYKPVFKREFGYLAAFSFAVSISGTFSTISTTFVYPLEAGGSASAVWCWLISGAGCMCIALSVSELVSAYPTCGGLYYTVSRLAPREWVPSISWVTGWLNLLGQVAGVASSEWGAAALLLATISIGTDFQYEPTTGQTVGVMAGLTVLTGLVNSLSTYWMEKMTKNYVIFHVLVIITCSVALLAMAQPSNGTPKHTAKYVFTDIHNVSGWTPNGWSFLFGFLSVSWTMTDYDATAHITEEIREPEIKAPWAISLAMLFTYVVGWLFTIVLCFCMGDVDHILGSKIAQPVAQIFFDVLGKSGGIVFSLCAFVIIKFVTFTAMQALGRTVFAFSRDRLVPFSNVWTKILPLTGTPILAVWISVCFCIAINLIGLGSYTAILGVFNVCAIALDWSYCIPIFCKLVFGTFTPGPWHLGKFSWAINVWACIWTFFVSIIFIMPTIMPVTPANMNYAIVYLAGILAFSTIYWYVRGRKFYTGPLIEAEVDMAAEGERSSEEVMHDKKMAGEGRQQDV